MFRGKVGGCTFDAERARDRGTGEFGEASRLRFVAVVAVLVFGRSSLAVEVPARGLPLRPEERCCCSESEVVGAGVVGGSGLTLGGRPTRLFGSSTASEAFDSTDWDRNEFAAGVALLSRGVLFLAALLSCFDGLPGRRFGLSGGGESWSDSGLTSLSSRDGLRGLKPDGIDFLFHGVELALRTSGDLVLGLGNGVVLAEAGY